jgi:phage tail protein X
MSAITYREIVTREGERWDTLAWRYYGDPFRYEPIIAANPQVPILPILPSGLVLQVPVLERAAAVVDDSTLPPWKRRRSLV